MWRKVRIVSWNVGLRGLRALAVKPQVALNSGSGGVQGDAHGVVRMQGYANLENLLAVVDGKGKRKRKREDKDDIGENNPCLENEDIGSCETETAVIICVQEVKQSKSSLAPEIAITDQYDSYFCLGTSAYAGVATFVDNDVRVLKSVGGVMGLRKMAGIVDRDVVEIRNYVCSTNDEVEFVDEIAVDVLSILKELDSEGRCITVHLSFCIIVNVYAPAAGEDGTRSIHKAVYIASIIQACRVLEKKWKKPVVVVGDLNVAYKRMDSASETNDIDYNDPDTEWERQCPARRCINYEIDTGHIVDCFRSLHQNRRHAYR